MHRMLYNSFAVLMKLKIRPNAVHGYQMNFPYKIGLMTVIRNEHGCDFIADELIFDKDILNPT